MISAWLTIRVFKGCISTDFQLVMAEMCELHRDTLLSDMIYNASIWNTIFLRTSNKTMTGILFWHYNGFKSGHIVRFEVDVIHT